MAEPGRALSTSSTPPIGGPLPPPAARPESIGPYRVLSVLGEGGFGIVYLAERREPFVQRVALKVIKPGMDSRAVLARFEQERQALAVMDHPNVAKVLDGGITPPEHGSRPYFVMEYVQGEAITTYCDRHCLSTRQRLELFIPVCEAVQHAHMKGIIHRDIKPSNVLVTNKDLADRPGPGAAASPSGGASWQVKVIDFGVAKAVSHSLTQHTIFTEHGQVIGTPEYMSPEQAEMGALDVDTRTDVYSLGVLLYELLAGLLPFDTPTLRNRAFDEVRRIIREVDPPTPSRRLSAIIVQASPALTGGNLPRDGGPPPSILSDLARRHATDLPTLARQLRRELEWIPLKAIRKDRSQRYRTPADLADDIANYLAGRPLAAGPESTGYKLRKFLRRNRVSVSAAGAVLAVLVLGVIGTTAGFVGQSRLRTIAEERERQALRAAEGERAARSLSDAKTAEAVQARAEADTQRDQARYSAYIAGLNAAASALRVSDAAAGRKLLDECPEEFRGWEWRFFDAQSDSSLRVWDPGAGYRGSIALSPEGSRAVIGYNLPPPPPGASPDAPPPEPMRVVDLLTGNEICRLATESPPWNARFGPDGSWVVAERDHKLLIWNTSTGALQCALEFSKTRSPTAGVTLSPIVSISPDGRLLAASGTAPQITLWDTATGKVLRSLQSSRTGGRFQTCAFHPAGTRLVTVDYTTLQVWDTATGAALFSLYGHAAGIQRVGFTPDGLALFSSDSAGALRLWASDTGAPLTTMSVVSAPLALTVSPDSRIVGLGLADGTAQLWEARTGRQVAVLRGHTREVRRVLFSNDSSRVFTSSDDGAVRQWNARTGEELWVYRGHTGPISQMVLSADGSRLVTCGNGAVRAWDTDPESCALQSLNTGGQIGSIAFNTDGTMLALAVRPVVMGSGPCTVEVWDLDLGLKVLRLERDPYRSGGAITFSPDGSKLAVADPVLSVFDLATGSEVSRFDSPSARRITPSRMAFDPEGKSVVLLGSGKVHVYSSWDRADSKPRVIAVPDDSVTSFAFSPDGSRYAFGLRSGCVYVVDRAHQDQALSTSPGPGPVVSLVFSADGTLLRSVSDRGLYCTWDTSSRGRVHPQRKVALPTRVRLAAVDPTANRLAVIADQDNAVALVDLGTGRELIRLRGHSQAISAIAFSPDGTRLVSASPDGTVVIRDAVPERERHARRTPLAASMDQARRYLDSALAPDDNYDRAAAKIRTDPTLKPDTRRCALALLPRRADEARTRHADEAGALVARLWPGTVAALVSPADRTERELVSKLRADTSLHPAVRDSAIARIQRRDPGARARDLADGGNARAGTRRLVVRSDKEPSWYGAALQYAERDARIYPESPEALSTLGLALYRCGQYQAALNAVTQARDLSPETELAPFSYAVIALSQSRLGRAEEAAAAIQRARDLLAEPGRAADEDTVALLGEAEALLETDR